MTKHPRFFNAADTRNILRRFLIWTTVLASGSGLAYAGASSDRARAADVEKLKHAERTWVESLETGNARRLATIIDADFTFIGPDGQLEKREAYLAGYEALPKMGVAVERIDMDEIEYRVLGDVGIVTGHVLARVKVQGAPVLENVRFTRVYRRSGQGWQMVAGQGTRIAENHEAPSNGTAAQH
jgi:ketosteroid isomerase-like protein